jgi:hypothetical protein
MEEMEIVENGEDLNSSEGCRCPFTYTPMSF